MSNDQRLRLEAVIASAERDEKTATELLADLHQQGDALVAVIERQQSLVTKLRDAVTAGREVLAGAVRLAGLDGLDAVVADQEGATASTLSELEGAVAAVPAPPTEQESPIGLGDHEHGGTYATH